MDHSSHITSLVNEFQILRHLIIMQYSPSIPGPAWENKMLNYKLLRTPTALALTDEKQLYTEEHRPIQQENTRLIGPSCCNQSVKPRKRRFVREICHCESCNFTGNEDKDRHTYNLAFNKPGYYVGFSGYPPACAAVNGDRSNYDRSDRPYNCVQTGGHLDKPLDHWLEYDFLDIYTIDKLLLYRRRMTAKLLDIMRLRAMDITVDGELCFSTPGYENDSMDWELSLLVTPMTCQKPLTGRYLRFSKRLEFNVFERRYHEIVFCEIVIWVCDRGYYGNPDTGCNPCPSADNCKYVRCDNYYGCSVMVHWNAAIKRETGQSSVFAGAAMNAVNGILLADSIDDCTVANRKSDSRNTSWWSVDLSVLFSILFVKVTNRHDCCGKLLKSFYVLVSRRRVDFTQDFGSLICHEFVGVFATGETKSFDCSPPLVGRYVFLAARHPYVLQFCEVRPYGFAVQELKAGENCAVQSKARYCSEGTICIKNLCRTLLGEPCSRLLSTCEPGSICEKGICVLAVNSPCGNSKVKCEDGSVCDLYSQSTCKYNFGSECRDNGSCIIGSVCDPLKTCKIPVQGFCKNHQNHCQYRALCDRSSDYHCKWDMGASCKDTGECKKGLVCDFFKRCKTPIGHSCNHSSECIGGASCQGSRCYCTSNDNSSCEPQEGRASGPCSGLTICVEHSACINGRCRCDTGYEVSEDIFSCKLSMGSACQDSQECTNGLVCDGLICRMETGNECVKTTLCKNDSHCDSGICKIKLGNYCNTFPHLCSLGSLCTDAFCKIPLESKCDLDNDHCKKFTMCSQMEEDKTPICRLIPGITCHGQMKTLCAAIAICDEDNVCKLKPGESCVSPNQNDCRSGTKCERGKCRLYLGSGCLRDDECEIGTVCDQLFYQCRLEADIQCAAPPPNDMCSSGAICNTDNKCQCFGSGITVRQGGKCEPASKKIGGPCNAIETPADLACDDLQAQCAYVNNSYVCQCISGYGVERTNYTCGAGAGAVCRNSNITIACNTGLTCDFSGFCSLMIGQRCNGENRRWCETGGVCEKDVCKINFNHECSGSKRDKCKAGTTCDILFRCKFPQNSSCSMADVCVAGSICQNSSCQCDPNITRLIGDICEAVDGVVTGSCKSSSCNDPNAICNEYETCECQEGYTVQSTDLSCKISVGFLCSVDESLCTEGSTCDGIRKKCSLELGQFCGDGNEDQCVTGAVCDVNGECKLDLSETCYDSEVFHCRYGTSCDWYGRCKIGVALICNKSNDCVAGAICVDWVCQCTATESVQAGLICEPKTGYIGGSCDDVIKCKPAGSFCSNETCQCGNGFRMSAENFHCVPSLGQLKQSGSEDLPLMIILGALAGIGTIAVCTALAVRKKKKKDIFEQELSVIKEDMEQLTQEVDEAFGVIPSDESSPEQKSTMSEASSSPANEASSTQMSEASSTQMSEASSTQMSEASSPQMSEASSIPSSEATSNVMDSMTMGVASDMHNQSEVSKSVLRNSKPNE